MHPSDSLCTPISNQPRPDSVSAVKKKKKKKQKKPSSTVDPALLPHSSSGQNANHQVLCISRNKHWRYISSYHGPWLQLPIELLDSVSVFNTSPQPFSTSDPFPVLPRTEPHSPLHAPISAGKRRDRGFETIPQSLFPESCLIPESFGAYTRASYHPDGPIPPPIDPGVLKSVTAIRRLIDEASELSVRASSGLSSAELSSTRGAPSLNSSTWATAQALGINPLGNVGNGRHPAMSAIRIRRLRALAVQKLAQAYKIDEIASSVMVMQGGSVFDDLAERVLKADPSDYDARYVHFFHEKIPSRQLAESTSTQVLDQLIAAQPQNLHYYRTRGIVHCFRDEYMQATKDFTYALKEARAIRRAKFSAHSGQMGENRRGKKKKKSSAKFIAETPYSGLNGGDSGIELFSGELVQSHPSILPGAPEPIELQLLFMRGATHLQHAIHLIESAILRLEGITKEPSVDGAELRLCYLDGGKYGGVEIRNPLGPLGDSRGIKAQAYRAVLADQPFKQEVIALAKKSIRDHEKFLSHFDTIATPSSNGTFTLEERLAYALAIAEATRPGTQHSSTPSAHPSTLASFTTYHPLLIEAHFSILLCLIVLADFPTILPTFVRTATVMEGLEGHPVFLPPRSLSQAEFVEILDRLAHGWKTGTDYTSLNNNNTLVPFQSTSSNAASSSSQASSMPSSPIIPVKDLDLFAPRIQANVSSESDSESVSFKRERSQEENLECIRILLAQVLKRQKEQAEKPAVSDNGSKKSVPINIPLHGPRIEVILAWLAAVHLVELDGAA